MDGIANRYWTIRKLPFSHAVVPNVFERSIYDRLAAAFLKRIDDPTAPIARTANYGAEPGMRATLEKKQRVVYWRHENIRLVHRLALAPIYAGLPAVLVAKEKDVTPLAQNSP